MEISWNEITGQLHAKENISRIVKSGRIPHAFLFSGPEGTGKYFTALKFAQQLNYESSEKNEVIQKKIETLQQPYIKLIFPLPRGKGETNESGPTEKINKEVIDLIQEETNKKIQNPYYNIEIPEANNIKISSIRDIKKFLSFQFSDISYRVIIILDAHLMSDDAQNALLKSLEEPPEGVIFILTTPEKDLLFETIKSRCWQINFRSLTNTEVSTILKKHFSIEDKIANKASLFSGGSVIRALEIIDNDFEVLLDKTIKILRYSLAMKYYSAYLEIQPILSDASGKKFLLLLEMIIMWLNDVQKNKVNQSDYYFSDHIESLEKFNLRFHVNLTNVLDSIEEISRSFNRNANINILVFNLFCRIASLRFQQS